MPPVMQRTQQAQDNLDNQAGPVDQRCLFASDLDYADAEHITRVMDRGLLPRLRRRDLVFLAGNNG